MNFLEQVEKQSPKKSSNPKRRKSKSIESKVSEPSKTTNNTKSSKKTDVFFHGVKKRLVALKVEVANKTRVSELLKKKLRLAEEELRASERKFKEDINDERRESELALQKQLDFADRLLEDKKALNDRCEKLARELSKADETQKKKMDVARRHWTQELEKQKKQLLANEKKRREKWMEQKSQSIKQMTIKGLEPEIQRLIDKHRDQEAKLRDSHREEMSVIRAKMKKQCTDREAELRIQFRRENELNIQKLTDESRHQLELQQKKHEARIEDLLSRHAQSLGTERERYEQERKKLRSNHADEIKKYRHVGDDKIEEMRRKEMREREEMKDSHRREIENLKRLERESRAKWERDTVRELRDEFKKKLEEKEARFAAARDRKLKLVIERLNEETASVQEKEIREIQIRSERVVRDLRERIQKAESREIEWKRKYTKLFDEQTSMEKTSASHRQLLKNTQDELERAQTRVRQLTGALRQSQKLCEDRESSVRKQEQELKHLRTQLSENSQSVKSHQDQIEALKKEHENALESTTSMHEQKLDHLNNRVRETVFRKDETIAALQEQLDSATLRMKEFERLLGSGSSVLTGL